MKKVGNIRPYIIGPSANLVPPSQYTYTGQLFSINFADFVFFVGNKKGSGNPRVKVTIKLLDD